VNRNRIGLSFGYLLTDERVGADGIKELLAIDVFEITLTAAPANVDTRVLTTKTLDIHPDLIGTASIR
jgi:Caudovirus prohead serine protease